VAYPHGTIRAVTHHGVTAQDIDRVLAAAAQALTEAPPAPTARSSTALLPTSTRSRE